MIERVELTPTFILHRRPYRDTSLLLELFSPEHGRVGAVARGGRSPNSRLRGLLHPFLPLSCSWGGRGELATLRHAEGSGPPLLSAPPATLYGLYLNELLVRLLPRRDASPTLFHRYAHTLAALGGTDPEGALRVFERDLLATLGYALILEEDEQGRAVEAGGYYLCRPGHPPVPVAPGTPHAVPGGALLALAQGDPTPQHRGVLRRLTRAALAPLLGDRPLRSRDLFRAYQRREGAGKIVGDIITPSIKGERP